ncbi:hypothetical protein DXG03_008439 [Asterophora parasitica]|uniref:Uncharacterized protein n=1 Tax=Asterophora parasitica TaxID=117018 RepID=A0A9P7KHE8_9AGAR|nr:hypothetical protein DXG03_008439 [Asterophora parasitica]
MRPLMTPDPVCASCRGSFVEKVSTALYAGPGSAERSHPRWRILPTIHANSRNMILGTWLEKECRLE